MKEVVIVIVILIFLEIVVVMQEVVIVVGVLVEIPGSVVSAAISITPEPDKIAVMMVMVMEFLFAVESDKIAVMMVVVMEFLLVVMVVLVVIPAVDPPFVVKMQ
jgi:hypothetical protein